MCKCNSIMNEKLAERNLNTIIDEPYMLTSDLKIEDSQKVKIVTAKADRSVRKRPTTVIASYCPFCGEKYDQ